MFPYIGRAAFAILRLQRETLESISWSLTNMCVAELLLAALALRKYGCKGLYEGWSPSFVVHVGSHFLIYVALNPNEKA